MQTISKNFERLCECIDSTVNGWQRADRLSQIEQRERAQSIIYGIARAALYVLNEEEYHAFVEYIHGKGFNH